MNVNNQSSKQSISDDNSSFNEHNSYHSDSNNLHDEQQDSNSLIKQLADKLGASSPRRLHPISVLFILLDRLMTLMFVLIIAIFQIFSDVQEANETSGFLSGFFASYPVLCIVLFIVMMVVLVFPIINFWFYRFQILDGELRISWGVINSQQRHIPLIKIHNVAIKQTLLQRLLKVAEVTLESAGSGQESEAVLKVLSIEEALLLEASINAKNLHASGYNDNKILVNTSTTVNGVNEPEESTASLESSQLLGLSNHDIIRYGIISNAGLALGGFLTLILSPERIIQWLWITFVPDDILKTLSDDMEVSGLEDVITISNILMGEQSLLVQVMVWLGVSLGLLFSVLILSKIYSVVSAFIQLYDFKLSKNGKNLTVEKGLFTRHKSNIPLSKIQVWRVEETWLHRLFKRQTLKIDTAILATPQSEQKSDRGINELIPLAQVGEIEKLLHSWQQPFPEEYDFIPVHKKAFFRIAFLRVIFVIFLLSVACVIFPNLMVFWFILSLVAFVFLMTVSYKSAHHMGIVVTNSHIMWREGWLNRVCFIMEIAHTHAIAINHSPFDRRHGMATLIVDTVGGSLLQARMTMKYLPYDVAEEVAEIIRVRCDGL